MAPLSPGSLFAKGHVTAVARKIHVNVICPKERVTFMCPCSSLPNGPCAGRTADTAGLNLESVGVKAESNGKLKCVSEQTNVDNIYAIGDVLYVCALPAGNGRKCARPRAFAPLLLTAVGNVFFLSASARQNYLALVMVMNAYFRALRCCCRP